MIHSVTVINDKGEYLKLDLIAPEASGLAVLSIDGLGPGAAVINTTTFSTTDGGFFNSARIAQRNIVFNLLFTNDRSVEETRQKTYKYFPLKGKVTLIIENDNRLVKIDGYIESNETSIFSNSQGSTISMICPDPLFRSAKGDGITTTTFGKVEPAFQFPFGNESTTENLLEVSTVSTIPEKLIKYEGDTETGVLFTLHASGPVNGIINIYNLSSDEALGVDTDKIEAYTGDEIGPGDDIIINTNKGYKSAYLVRNGIYINILNCLVDSPNRWIRLIVGDNVFIYTVGFGSNNLYLKIENHTVYTGV